MTTKIARRLSALLVSSHFLLFGAIDGASANEDFIAAVDWSKIERLVVMNYDIPVSLRTYSIDRIASLTGKTRLDAEPPAYTLCVMLFAPETMEDKPIIEVRDSDLRKIFGAQRVSLKQLSEQRTLERIRAWTGSRPAVPEDGSPPDAETRRRLTTWELRIREFSRLTDRAEVLANAAESFAVIPTRTLRNTPGEWLSVEQAAQQNPSGKYDAIIARYHAARDAFRSGDAEGFQGAMEQLDAAIRELPEWPDVPEKRVALELRFTRLTPFYWAAWGYLLAALFFAPLLAERFKSNRALWIAALSVLAVSLAVMAAGITIRGILVQRLPLSNLHESLLFSIAGMVLLAVVFEVATRRLYCGLAGALLGALFTGMGNALPISMTRPTHMMAALQSYWLHLHVTVIMLSYSAFALSFFICLAYLFRVARLGLAAAENDETLPYLESLNFRVIIVGFPLLSAGIVLGAVWANTAWQRPWGWDPKEVWAAITWIIYAIYIHARLVFKSRQHLLMILAFLGFLAVVFTYIGVSFLLPGLHSYLRAPNRV